MAIIDEILDRRIANILGWVEMAVGLPEGLSNLPPFLGSIVFEVMSFKRRRKRSPLHPKSVGFLYLSLLFPLDHLIALFY